MTTAETSIDGIRLRFVLSTGRTGTTQLREFLKKSRPELGIEFEPHPSRLAYLIWNAERAGYLPDGLAYKLIYNSKQHLLKKHTADKTVIEFDSYLSPLACQLLPHVHQAHVIHMVRHPYTWITSIGNFKAASWRKYAVDIVPFTETVHPKVAGKWRELGKLEKLAWSWRYVNECILEQKNNMKKYELIKFEDFVSIDQESRTHSISKMLQIIDPDYDGEILDINASDKINKSKDRHVEDWENWPADTIDSVNNICGDLIQTLGYEIQKA